MKNYIKLYRNENRVGADIVAPSCCALTEATVADYNGTALTIGNFDGVHLGHQALLKALVEQAREHHLRPTVLTFSPHPREFFALREHRPELIPTRVSSLRDKLCALQQAGIQTVCLARFDQAKSQMSATDFIQDILLNQLHVKRLLVGHDFRFGHKRSGTLAMLHTAGQQHGFTVQTIDDVLDSQQIRYSSTELRTALGFGDVRKVQHYLGRPYTISGHVIHGKKLGRTIGFPTLNLAVMPRCALQSGVYVVSVHGLREQALPAIASLGVRPTVESNGEVLLEVHILNHSVCAYGKLVSVAFHQFVRDEEKFSDLPTMIEAIHHDCQIAQHYFSVHGL